MRIVFPALVVVLLAGCKCSSNVVVGGTCSATEPCAGKQVCMAGKCVAAPVEDAGAADAGNMPDAGPAAHATALTLDPAMAQLVSTNGSKPSQAYVARFTFSDGTTSIATNAVFSTDQDPMGTIDPIGGIFTASAQVGGALHVKATASSGGQAFNAQADLTIRLEWVVGPADAGMLFADAGVTDPVRTADVVYPLDGVVFPQNVAPADVQWLNGAIGDGFRIRLMKPSIRITAYLLDDGDHHWLVDAAAWRALAQTEPAQPAVLTVDRLEMATAQLIAGAPRSMRFTRSAVSGTVYYWDIEAGRIMRIDDGTTQRTNFMPTPPPAITGERCVGCHVVSPSGHFMAGRLGGGENIGGIFDLTANLLPNPAPTLWPTSATSPRWWTSSFNPSETQIVVSVDEGGVGGMGFIDPRTGGVINVAGAPVEKLSHVAWSPDGKSIAYVNHFVGWGGEATAGDITVIPVLGPASLGTAVTIHHGTDLPPGTADSYPTWSPDSKWIVFANGTGNRSDAHQAALYSMSADGGQVQRLNNASGGPTGVLNFQPRFSPFQGEGYFWLSFLSRRDYGNDKRGTRGKGRQQIWVAAVKVGMPAGQDPSEVGYWLPGQDTASKNISAFWAPRACRQKGEVCSVGSECCSSICAANAQGGLVCSPPPPDRCRVEGESCSESGDCCPNKGLTCKLNTCIIDIN
jgi:hypothetical protein